MANQSDLPELIATDPSQTEAVADMGAPTLLEPSLWGLEPYQIVSVSMLVLLLIAIFVFKAHKTIAGGLDRQIAAIKEQLDEAKQLRAEAEALRKEYADKIAGAEKDAEAMLANAQTEADAILSQGGGRQQGDGRAPQADGRRQDRRSRTRSRTGRTQPCRRRCNGCQPHADRREARCRSRSRTGRQGHREHLVSPEKDGRGGRPGGSPFFASACALWRSRRQHDLSDDLATLHCFECLAPSRQRQDAIDMRSDFLLTGQGCRVLRRSACHGPGSAGHILRRGRRRPRSP